VIAAYEELLARAESELALACEGRWGELAAAGAERARVAAALPPAPAAARPLLERERGGDAGALGAGVDELVPAALAAARELALGAGQEILVGGDHAAICAHASRSSPSSSATLSIMPASRWIRASIRWRLQKT